MSIPSPMRQGALLLCIMMLSGYLWGESRVPQNAVWIDVRSPQEFDEGHLEGAVLIPYDAITAGVLGRQIPKDTPLYLYCAVGGRAEVAKQELKTLGYRSVTNVGGLENARHLQRDNNNLATGQ